MGWLGGGTRVTVGTQATRAIKDAQLPNAARTGTVRAILNDGDISEHVLEETANSIGLKADRMYAWAQANYVHGLPSGAMRTATFGRDEAEAILADIEGAAAVIDYIHISTPNALHIAWTQLLADWGYNPSTNELAVLTASKGTAVYLKDMQVMLHGEAVDPAADVLAYQPVDLEQWGLSPAAGYTPWRAADPTNISHQPVLLDVAVTTPKVRVSYVWAVAGSETGETMDLDVATGFEATDDYFHVRYTVGGTVKYWMYHIEDGTYPTLDAVYANASTLGTYFPFAYFRYAHVSELADTTSASYLSGKKLVKYLGMDFDQVATGIDQNPDIEHVEQAMLMMAVPANTTDALERQYLFDYFTGLYDSGAAVDPDAGLSFFQQGVVIQDARFKMTLGHSGILRRTITGSIGAVGTHDSALGTVLVPTEVASYTGIDGAYTVTTVDMEIKTHIYRRQVNATEYVEVEVANLATLYHVLGKYSVLVDDVDDVLLVPLDRAITESGSYSARDKETLYARSLHFVFNSVLYTHVSWYQTDFFKFILVVASIVMLGLNPEMAALTQLLEAGATDLVLLLVEHLVLQFVITTVAFKLIARAVGPEAALILAVVAITVAGYEGLSGSSLPGIPFAEDLLKIANGLVKAAMTQLQQKLLKEYSEFNAFAKEKDEELSAANKLLEQNNWMNPFMIFGEKPEDFFNRTVHSGNIGMLGISAISKYVDTALTLPKLDQTIGAFTYG